MRMLYTSPRVENADRVVRMLLDHGIAARVTNDGGWRGRDHRRFSYLAAGSRQASWPQVWVIKAEDQPQARALLREIGIEPAVRHGELLKQARGLTESVTGRRRAMVTRIRLVLLAVIGVLVLLTLIRWL